MPQQLFTSFSTSTPQFKYDLDRNKAKLLGLEPARRVQHAADLSRLALRQRLQPVRPHLPRHDAGRQGRARSAADLSRLYVRNAAGGMVPLSTLGTSQADRRPRDRAALQQLRLGADQRRRRRRASARARRSPRWSGPPRRRCRATSASNGPASPSRSSRRDRSRASCSALAIVFVFLILAAQYESWSMPFMVLLAVPLALFGALLALVAARHADRRLFADRLRDADRARGQERDSDRRVRQASARGRPRHRRSRDGSGAAAAAARS